MIGKWVLVPLEPTHLMNDVGIEALDRLAGENNCAREHLNEVWRVMVKAAPPPLSHLSKRD